MTLTKPKHVLPENHLRLEMSDIAVATEGRIAPSENHIRALLDFLPRWSGGTPLLIHCLAGLSRSPAAAFTVLCALNPDIEERILAHRLREANTMVNPNSLIVGLGDRLLQREGRMLATLDVFADAGHHEEGVLFSFAAGE